MAEPITIDQPTAPVARAQPAADPRMQARQRLAARERLRFGLVLLVALVQGVVYLLVQPPWQHYDEPTHFEYAWLSANRTLLPTFGDEDPAMRREVAASMQEHGFFRTLPRSDLLTDGSQPWLGVTELGHLPTYYVLVSMPLRLVRWLDVTSQLYVARTVSLLLLLLTVACAYGLLRDLTPPGHALRWAVPLAMVLLPPFVDVMTSVNNDVGVVFAFSAFVWGAVRLLLRGSTWRRLAWVCAAAGLALLMKNTGAPAIVLAVLALVGALWLRRGWRWRWLVGGIALALLAAIPATLAWGDAAYWYRNSYGPAQTDPTQATIATPLGPHALLVEATADSPARQLIGPLLPADVQRVAGKTITIGGWLWADRTAQVGMPLPVYSVAQIDASFAPTRLITVTTTPRFVAQTVHIPANIPLLQYTITARSDGAPLRLFLDGAVIAEGAFSAVPPTFDSAAAAGGTWNGQRFANLVRNGSGEQAWPHLRPWLDQRLYLYIHRSPSQTVGALFDMQRNGPLLLTNTGLWILFTFFGVFGWSNVQLNGWGWTYGFQAVVVLALAGAVAWLARQRARFTMAAWATCAFLAATLLLIWGNTVLRPLPLLDPNVYYPVARYGFPAILPTMLALVGGWWALWPRRFRALGVAGLVAGLAALNGVALATIISFYQ